MGTETWLVPKLMRPRLGQEAGGHRFTPWMGWIRETPRLPSSHGST
jgi:hypothetical protein